MDLKELWFQKLEAAILLRGGILKSGELKQLTLKDAKKKLNPNGIYFPNLPKEVDENKKLEELNLTFKVQGIDNCKYTMDEKQEERG